MPDKFDEKFQDPKTGETVTRIKVPEQYLPEIEKNTELNAQHSNNFMQLSRQCLALEEWRKQEFNKAKESEQNVGKEVIRIREKMGLDSGWIYNIALKMMEKREPPIEEQTMGEGVK